MPILKTIFFGLDADFVFLHDFAEEIHPKQTKSIGPHERIPIGDI